MLTLEKSDIPHAMLKSLNNIPMLYAKHTASRGYYHCIIHNGLATLRYSPFGHPDRGIYDNKKFAYIIQDNDSVLFSLPELMEFITDKQPASISFTFL